MDKVYYITNSDEYLFPVEDLFFESKEDAEEYKDKLLVEAQADYIEKYALWEQAQTDRDKVRKYAEENGFDVAVHSTTYQPQKYYVDAIRDYEVAELIRYVKE